MLLDVTRLVWRRWEGRRPTGIDRVCLSYLRHFGDRAQAVVQHRRIRRILDRDGSSVLFDLLDAGGPRFRRRLAAGALRHGLRGSCSGDGRFYFNLGHTGLDQPGFRPWLAHADVRPIFFVHDLIPITHPEFCRAGEASRHSERMRTVLSTAAGVIGNSRSTLDELATFADDQDLPMPPGLVAWLGCEPLPDARTVQAREPTFIVLGTIEGRKNHLLLLNIWIRLIDRLGDAAPKLQIIGQRGWEAEHVFDILDQNERLRSHVVELNQCSDARLAQHFAAARALLFPSLAEGYGLPLIEALSAGLPAIASDLPVFREICGEIPTYVDPLDGPGWESAIMEFARPQSAARAAQLERMKGFHAPDWPSHFRAVEAWLPTLASAA